MTFPANSSAAAIATAPSSYIVAIKLKGRTLVSTRFLVALALVVFHALLGTCPEAGAQTQNNVPVQNGSVFNPEGPAPLTGPSALAVSNDAPPNGTTRPDHRIQAGAAWGEERPGNKAEQAGPPNQSDDQTSIFVRTRRITSSVNPVVL